ncbi:anthocyanidin 3-O-glucoside 2'''-O-xylosyltransferase [Ranunculus cassubicifolius]
MYNYHYPCSAQADSKAKMATPTLHVAMFPWFAMGHITPFLHLSNKLAENGHKISFFIPTKTQNKINHLNLHPHLFKFIPLEVNVDGHPDGAETTEDVRFDQHSAICKAFDLTQEQLGSSLLHLKPDFIFHDLSYWLPSLVKPMKIISVYFATTSAMNYTQIVSVVVKDMQVQPPEIYPGSSSVKPPSFLLKEFFIVDAECDGNISFFDRAYSSMKESEVLCFPGFISEIEAPFIDYLESHFNKPFLILEPTLNPTPTSQQLEKKWDDWLSGFDKGSVVYCALGTEANLEKDQFQELLLGLELTHLPFLARLKAPKGAETVQEGFPEGFENRVKGRGVVYGDWVPQKLILDHPSVGCFVSHCGYGSMFEALVSECQVVLVPQHGDQFANAGFMSKRLNVAVEVERRDDDGWFSRENVCKAVKSVMDDGVEIGEEKRANHQKLSRLLMLAQGVRSDYFNKFINQLQVIRK